MDDDPGAALADWSAWVPLAQAITTAPALPGVYLVRTGEDGPVVYSGHAGERSSNGRRSPQGIRGRLRRYASGKALTSGFGEAAADRAFADQRFIRDRLAEVEAGRPMRAAAWGRVAIESFVPYCRWAVTADKVSAEQLERLCIATYGDALWNRQRRS